MIYEFIAILKRALKDYGHKIHNPLQLEKIAALIKKAKVLLSHYIYLNVPYGWTDIEFRGTYQNSYFLKSAWMVCFLCKLIKLISMY